MTFTTPTELAAYTRLQTNLWTGLTFFPRHWHYEAKDWVTCVHAADIDQNGDTEVLAGSRDGRVTALSKEGGVLWEWEMPAGDKSWVTALVAYPTTPTQKIACVVSTRSGKIYVLDQDGKAVPPPTAGPQDPVYWYSVATSIVQMRPDTSRPLSVVFAAENYEIYCLDLVTNQLRWSYSAGARVRDVFPYDINKDGFAETLVGSDDHHLYMLSRDGKLLSSCRLEQAVYTLYALDIDQDGEIEILASTRTRKLFALTSKLQHKWSYHLSSRLIALTVADVNDDRELELLISCDDQSLTILDAMGKLTWRQKTGSRRYYSLNAFDLDRDGHMELLVGADDSRVYALGVQVTKDLNKKISRDYHKNLGKPEITTLLDLTNDQLNLLLGVLGFNYGLIDKTLHLGYAREQIAREDWRGALLTLLKLEKQRFQMLWEKEELGFRRALCLMDLRGDQQSKVVVGSRDGGLSVFNFRGRHLWSERSVDGAEIVDAQPGFLSAGHSEDLVYVSAAGTLSVFNGDRKRTESNLRFSEQASCFYVFAPGGPTASEILIGTKSGKVHLYTSDFTKPARIFPFSSAIDRVYISEPDESGLYHSPELLISTSDNTLYACSRGGNCLWRYETRDQIRALCVKDLDNDGHLEVLIGLDDRNIYVLDDNGILCWRYVLYHSVLALETADLDGDGKQEILVGCADGVFYVFTSVGDLIWRYTSRDRIQALRVADIDRDGNFEIALVEEGHLEVLRVVRQKELDELLEECWRHLLEEQDPAEALHPFLTDNDPNLRAASLLKLSRSGALTPETMLLLGDAVTDAFTDVRKVLPEALMNAYSADPALTYPRLNMLFTDRQREVSIEVVEHLEILAKYDWNTTLSYLERALRSDDRNTRRAALRKIAHLMRTYKDEIKNDQEVLGEKLFQLLLSGALDKVPRPSIWVKQEAGRVLADFLNLFHEHFLPYLYRMFDARLEYEALRYVSANIADASMRQAVICLVDLSVHFDFQQAPELLVQTASALEQTKTCVDGTDLWLIYRELQALFSYTTLEKLAPYDFHLKEEQFLQAYQRVPAFLRIGEYVSMVTHPLKTYVRCTDPSDRLHALLDSINALETLQRVVDREYNVSPLPDAPLPLVPEFVALRALFVRWQELCSEHRNELRGHAELAYELQSRTVRLEKSPRKEDEYMEVGIWLQISNTGRALARDVQVTLLAGESYTRQSSSVFTANIIQIG